MAKQEDGREWRVYPQVNPHGRRVVLDDGRSAIDWNVIPCVTFPDDLSLIHI